MKFSLIVKGENCISSSGIPEVSAARLEIFGDLPDHTLMQYTVCLQRISPLTCMLCLGAGLSLDCIEIYSLSWVMSWAMRMSGGLYKRECPRVQTA